MSNSLQPFVAHQASLSMGFSRQEFWSGLPCPPPGHLPDPGIKSVSLHWWVGSLLLVPPGKPNCILKNIKLKKKSVAVLLKEI